MQPARNCDTTAGVRSSSRNDRTGRDSVQTAPQCACTARPDAPRGPADAIKRSAEGGLTARKPRCIACSNCVLACPFGVPKYDGDADQMMKCDMCYDRTSTGRRPMCATVCPSGALAFTTIEEIMRTRQGRAVNDWQFGDQHVRTKVFVLVPTEVRA